MFTGQQDRTLDDKSRLVLPSAFRRPYEGQGGRLSPGDRCLVVFPEDVFSQVAERMNEKWRSGEVEDDDVVRVFFSNTVRVELDNQGRFMIPERSRAYAGIARDVTVVGHQDHLELWDTASYRAVETAKSPESVSAQLRRMRVF